METKTPQNSYPKLAKALGVSNIILKREDLNPYGSHKGRSIPLMIETYIKKGTTNFVISSSGNAALASIRYIQENNKVNTKVTLKILIEKNLIEKLRGKIFLCRHIGNKFFGFLKIFPLHFIHKKSSGFAAEFFFTGKNFFYFEKRFLT